MGLIRRRRCIRYAHPGHQRTAELRGLAVFKAAQVALKLLRPLGGHGRVNIGAEIRNPCFDELLFIIAPSSPDVAEYIEWCNSQRYMSTVVDVVADTLGLLPDLHPEMQVSHDGRGDQEAWAWWSHPDRQDALRRSIVAADVVTTSWPQLVEPLRELNPTVMLLPDWHWDSDSSGCFEHQFLHVMKTANADMR
jgi:hypothetical protein